MIRTLDRIAMIVTGIIIATAIALAMSPAHAANWGHHHLTSEQAVSVRAIREVWKPQGVRVVRQALRVSWCESRFLPWAQNRHSTARGIFQLLYHAGRGARQQARRALTMYRQRHWQPWSCA